MDRIPGSYPGGPKRPGVEEEAPRRLPHRLRRAEDYEEGAQQRQLTRTRKARRRRLLLGGVVVLLVAVASGLWLGFQAHQSAEDLAQGGQNELSDLLNFKAEADRVLHEIWRMEDFDRGFYNRQSPW